jgi:hypothetical protein
MSFLNNFSLGISALGQFWQEKINSQILRWNLLIIGLQILLITLKFNDLPPQVPLFYSLPWGETQLAHTNQLFVLPIYSIIIALANNIMAALYLSRQNHLLARLLVIFSLVYSFLSGFTLLRIIYLIS